MFYKALAQSVLLYGCETWDLTSTTLLALRGFHHRVARRITGMLPALQDGEWVTPPAGEALRAAGMHSIDEYITVRQRTIVEKVATRPIMQLCNSTERLSGSSGKTFWWQQPLIMDLRNGPNP